MNSFFPSGDLLGEGLVLVRIDLFDPAINYIGSYHYVSDKLLLGPSYYVPLSLLLEIENEKEDRDSN